MPRRRRAAAAHALWRWSWPSALATTLACHGAPAPFDDESSADSDAPVTGLGASMRRLSAAQYERTVRAAFGDALPEDFAFVEGLPLDDRSGWFLANDAPLGEAALAQYETTAEQVAAVVVARRGSLDPCLGAAAPSDDCVRGVIDRVAQSSWRRPIDARESAGLWSVFRPDDAGDLEAGLRAVITTVLQSPDFLYRIERGAPDLRGGNDLVLGGHEIAARMSYLLWDGPPDASLVADAAAGRLHDPLWRTRVVERMLRDPRSAIGLGAMHRAWLGVEHLPSLVKDRNVFPTFSDGLGGELDQELVDFVDHVVRERDGTLASLLTANVTVAGPAVTAWYGDDVVARSEDAARGTSLLELDPLRRAGVLTLMATMAAHAKTDRTDPVRRGVLVRTRLLCEPLAAPPPDVPALPEAVDEDASLRERLAAHTADPACAQCHRRIDPIGFAFERYDAMGQYRVGSIDDDGEIVGTDVAGQVDGPVALAHALGDSDDVARCYVGQWLRWALGRDLLPDDEEVLAALETSFIDSGGHVPTLVAELVAHPAFVVRGVP